MAGRCKLGVAQGRVLSTRENVVSYLNRPLDARADVSLFNSVI